ncbi:MAG: fibronectin type III domain-containing protein [Candidatus Parvibacillus calidus]|nr:MAG: fibronectin type III domain-containing protein [Candidatus Parvibacillus calidus]
MNIRYNHSSLIIVVAWILSVATTFSCLGQAPSITIIASPGNSLCVGDNLTMASTISDGGAFTFSYQWYKNNVEIPGATNDSYSIPNIQLIDAGTYKVVATYDDMGNQEIDDQIIISVNPKPAITAIQKEDPTTCNGQDGSFTLVGLAGTGYQLFYTLNGTEVGPINLPVNGEYKVSNLAAGNYTNIYVIKNNCKSNSQSVSLTDPPAPVITSITGKNPTTCGGQDGYFTVAGLSGTGYQLFYTLNGIEVGPVAIPVNNEYKVSNLAAGNYTNIYVIKDGCKSNAREVVLTEPPKPIITNIKLTHPTTCDGADGSLELEGLTGTGFKAYYTIGGSEKNIDLPSGGKFVISNLKAGSYSNIYVIKANCKSDPSSGPFELQDPGFPPTIVVDITLSKSKVCKGGTVDVTTSPAGGTLEILSGGGSLFNGVLNTGSATGNTITLQYTYTDNNSKCTKIVQKDVTVNPLPVLASEPDITHVRCNGEKTGSISLSPDDYTYRWSTGALGNSITGLPAGNYSVTFTDANGCVGTRASIAITEPSKLTEDALQTEYVVCFGKSKEVTPQVNGGTPPYSYTWVTPQGTSHNKSIVLKSSWTYKLTITDANSCELEKDINLVVNDEIKLELSSSGGNKLLDHFCAGASITLTASGADSYEWGDNQMGSSIIVKEGGDYKVTGSKTQNNLKCYVEKSIKITKDPLPEIVFSDGTNTGDTLKTCKGTSLNITVSNNKPSYSYSWSDGSTSSTRVLYEEKKYPITVTDNNTGCSDASTLDLQYKNRIFLQIVNVADIPIDTIVNFCTQPTKTEVTFKLNGELGPKAYASATWWLDTDIIGNSKEIVIDFNKQTKNFKLKVKTFDQAGCEMSQTISFIQNEPTSDIFDEYKCGVYKLKPGYSLEGSSLPSNIQDLGSGFYFITGKVNLEYTLKNDAGECRSKMDKDFVSKITSGEFADDQFVIDECGPFLLARHKEGFCYDWYRLDDQNKAIRIDSAGNSWLKVTQENLIKNKYIAIGYDCKNSCDSTFISTRSDGDEVVIPCGGTDSKSLKAYPNPGSGHMYIQAAGLSPGKQTLDIYNMMGTRIYSMTIGQAESNLLTEVSLLDIPNGIYLVRLGNDKAEVTGKIIVIH